jgi:hypothetical protein
MGAERKAYCVLVQSWVSSGLSGTGKRYGVLLRERGSRPCFPGDTREGDCSPIPRARRETARVLSETPSTSACDASRL